MSARTFVISSTDLASVRLAENSPKYRQPKQLPPLDREALRDKYDFRTFFFDVFRMEDNSVRGIGPRPFNLRPVLQLAELDLGGINAQIRDREDISFSGTKKLIRLDIDTDTSNDQFTFTAPKEETVSRTIQPSGLHLFDGKRVLMTMIKYDHLEWLQQWVEFFVRAHGVDAVLIYNNEAPDYTSHDIARILSPIDGLSRIGVIDWFFPYGAGVAEKGNWISAYTQVGAMIHARSRFLGRARCVVNADVDELVFCEKPGDRLCDLTEKSATGYLRYQHRWACGPEGTRFDIPPEKRRYADYHHIDTSYPIHGSKWSCRPSVCSDDHEFSVHGIGGLVADKIMSPIVSFRNMPDFNTGWKSMRPLKKGPFENDPVMVRTYQDIGWL